MWATDRFSKLQGLCVLSHTAQLTDAINAPFAVQVYLQTAPGGAEEGWTANFSSMMTKLLQESYDGSKVQREAQLRTEALATLTEVPGLPPLPDLPPKVRGAGVGQCINRCELDSSLPSAPSVLHCYHGTVERQARWWTDALAVLPQLPDDDRLRSAGTILNVALMQVLLAGAPVNAIKMQHEFCTSLCWTS